MKKNVILYILLAFLIIVNGFFLVNQFGKSNKRQGKEPQPKNFIIKELKFDASQIEQYETLYDEHKEKIKSISDNVRTLKDDFFDKVSDESVNASVVDSLATLIANAEKAKDIETFFYFRAIQKICNDKQKERFKTILKDALHKKRRNGRSSARPNRVRDNNGPPPRPH